MCAVVLVCDTSSVVCAPCSFGDTKFIPSVSPATVNTIVTAASATAGPNTDLLLELWSGVHGPMFDLRARLLQLGLGPTTGISSYYTPNFTEEDAAFIQKFYDSKAHPQPYNTRVFKTVADGKTSYQIRLASTIGESAPPADLLLGTHEFNGASITIVQGDYGRVMGKVAAHLLEAASFAGNETQVSAGVELNATCLRVWL